LEESFMRRAIALAEASVESGGGPFGAIVVRGGAVLGEGANRVVPDADPTQHAEIVAIREACRRLGTHDLSGAMIFTSCEPCPMCLGAIWWARIGEVVFGNRQEDAARIGFDDRAIYREVARPHGERVLPIRRLLGAEAARAFEMWEGKADKTRY
jgi:tRNA(Arg) A34 adenosine deaminase TadA